MFAKCLVRVGQTATPAAPPLGTRIELVPKGDPTSLRAGDGADTEWESYWASLAVVVAAK